MAQIKAKMTDKVTKSEYEYEYKDDYNSDFRIHRQYINSFDAFEAMLLGQVFDTVSASVDGSKITDSYAATLAIERAARVMGKLPDGIVESGAKADEGKAALMDIIRQKYIYPNANSQHNFDTKLRLWQLYSSVYGYMPMFYDWTISNSGYIGPDCWLWNPRMFIPQQGRTSVTDMEYVTAETFVSKTYLKNILDNMNDTPETDQEEATEAPDKLPETLEDGWDRPALQELYDLVDQETTSLDANKDTMTERQRIGVATKRGIRLATRYEAGDDGRWCTFAPDHGFVQVRDLPNPHKNGRIPFVIKYSQPLFDSFYGMGDFQRAKPLQFARDGLTNFYFKGIKMNLIPPIVANANGVLKHTLDYREGAVMMETIPNSIRRLETSNAGLATFQAAQSALTGSLLSLFGSQNASITGSDALNPSQGKTPAAIDLYGDKEATRDGQERMYLEGAIQELTNGFFSLIANIGTEDIPIGLYSEDIQEIVDSGLSDVEELFTGKGFSANKTQTGGELRIDPNKLRGTEFRFRINSGSTAKINKQQQLQELDGIMDTLAKFQNIFKDDPRVDIDWGAMLKEAAQLTDIPGASKFVQVKPGPNQQELQQQQEQEQAQQQAQQAREAISINYKDAPPEIQRQMESRAGFQPATMAPPPEPTGSVLAGNPAVPAPTLKDPHLAAAAQHIANIGT